jgi:predicted ATPase/DNA-binding CsgD family transcriptional regulator
MDAPTAPPPPLPVPFSTLVGREAEIERAIALLRLDAVQLLTLVGPGGVGKSRLALAVAERAARAFGGRVWFVPLADVREPRLVLSAVAQAVGVREAEGDDLRAGIARRLADRDTLLVLDNLEQVLDVAPALGRLLSACPRLKVVATSRASLSLRGEQEFPVEPLIADLAVELFVQRARQVRPSFTLSDDNAATIAEIVRRLDGLPLAIELAAARTTILSPSALLSRLDHALTILTAGPRDLPSRQRTLAAAIAWSYDLLDPSERRLLAWLGVFAGGFTLEGAEAVGGAPTVLDLVASLVAKSLVRRETTPSGDRFRLLETVRAYALERLAATDEAACVRRSHAEHFHALVADPASAGLEASQRVAALDAERDNVRAALGWALNGGDPALGVSLALRLWRYWYLRGTWIEGRGWLETALATDRATTDADRLNLLHGIGAFSFALGDYPTAGERLDGALALARAAADNGKIAAIQVSYAHLERERGDVGAAVVRLEEALTLYRAAGDAESVARVLSDLGVLARRRGDVARAAELLDEAMALQRRSGDRSGLSKTLHGVAAARRLLGDTAGARAALEEARVIHRALGARSNEAYALNNLANLAAGAEDLAAEIAYYEEALAIFQEIGEAAGEGLVLLNLSTAHWNSGDRGRAFDCARVSLSRNRPLGRPLLLSLGLWAMADHAAAAGARELAARLHGAGEAAQAASDEVVPDEDRRTHDATVATLRRRLGEARFDHLVEEGRRLTLDEAIAEALTVPAPAATKPPARPAAESCSPDAPDHGLSPREIDVLRLVAQGLANKEIAAALGISPRTATTHVANILAKLDVDSRAAATAYALRHRIV